MASIERTVVEVERGTVTQRRDHLADESPVEIRLQGVPLAVLMRTPGDDVALARGFAITEGIVTSPDEIAAVEPVDVGDRWELRLADGVEIDPERFRRSAYVSSSCGVCGKASIDAVRVAGRRPPAGPRVTASLPGEWILALGGRERAAGGAGGEAAVAAVRVAGRRPPAGPRLTASLPGEWISALGRRQPAFGRTGGLHAAAVCEPDGTVLASAEDVGRHNAVDKAIGDLSGRRWPLGEVVLVVSGRISFEDRKSGV